MPVLSKGTSVPDNIYLFIGCAAVTLLFICIRRKSSGRNFSSIAPMSNSNEEEKLLQSHQLNPGPRIQPKSPLPPSFTTGTTIDTTTNPKSGVRNASPPSPPLSRPQNQLITTPQSHPQNPSLTTSPTTYTNPTKTAIPQNFPLHPPHQHPPTPPFPKPTSVSYDSATMPPYSEIPSTSSPPSSISPKEPSASTTSTSTYIIKTSPSPTSSSNPPRRRSYTKPPPQSQSPPQISTETDPEPEPESAIHVTAQIETGTGTGPNESWRRHTRVFGGGVCRACEESRRSTA